MSEDDISNHCDDKFIIADTGSQKTISVITGMICSVFADTGCQKTISVITEMISSVFADTGSQRTISVITEMISSVIVLCCVSEDDINNHWDDLFNIC